MLALRRYSVIEEKEGKCMRIGIFGGTFDPPHIGHLLLAQEAMEKAELERLVFIPCGNPPHKDGGAVTDSAYRLEMVRRAICDNPSFELSDMETKSDSPSYTAKTLERLSDAHPNDTLCFIVGADSLCEMETWFCPQRIFDQAEIIAAARGGANEAELEEAALRLRGKYGARITLIRMNVIELSSSEIRQRIADGKSTRYMLLPCVREYIKEKGIYAKR